MTFRVNSKYVAMIDEEGTAFSVGRGESFEEARLAARKDYNLQGYGCEVPQLSKLQAEEISLCEYLKVRK